MKVIIDTYNCINSNPIGGVQKRIKNVAKNLQEKQIEVELFDKWHTSCDNADVYHLFKVLPESYNIVQYVKNKGIPVVISSVLPIHSTLKDKIKTQLSILSHGSHYYIKRMLVEANAVIAQTELERESIINSYHIDRQKIEVIPNGVSSVYHKCKCNVFAEQYGIAEPYVVQVGSIEPNKNQLSVIKAAKELGINLVIIGGKNSSYPDYYDACVSESDDRIRFVGWIFDEKLLASAYGNAQVVILPSSHEIFGNSIFEGALAGANIVASEVLPLKSMGLDKYCFTINPNSQKDIIEKLNDAMNTQRRTELSEYVNDYYSWGSIIDKYISVYNKVLDI